MCAGSHVRPSLSAAHRDRPLRSQETKQKNDQLLSRIKTKRRRTKSPERSGMVSLKTYPSWSAAMEGVADISKDTLKVDWVQVKVEPEPAQGLECPD